jgi:hypothetical protein
MTVAITQTADPAGVASSAGVITYTDASIGTASSDRIVCVCAAAEITGATLDSATINYGSGDIAMSATSLANFGNVYARIFYLAVPTGTIATIKITTTTAVSNTQNHIAVYAVTGASTTLSASGTDTSTDMDATDPLTTGSITIPANGGFLAVIAGATSGISNKTWANATEDLDENAGAFGFSTAIRTTSGTVTVTCTGSSNGEDGALVYVVFNPIVDLVGIPWFTPPDILSRPQLANPHPGPAIALTPDTLPPQIDGMGWFNPPDPKQPRPLERPHQGPAITIEPPALLSKLIGVPWAHAPDDKPKSRPIFDNSAPALTLTPPSLLSRLIGTPWAHPPDDKPLSRPVRDNSAPAIALTPATLPPQIAGMAWFEPPDTFQPRRWLVQEPPAIGQVFATAVVPISGMAWFTPPDPRPPRPLERPQIAPAIALTPTTLPPKVAGMAWFTRPDVYQPRRWFPHDPPAYGRQILQVSGAKTRIIIIGM